MKIRSFRILTPLALAGVLAFGLLARADDPEPAPPAPKHRPARGGGAPGENLDKLKDELKLTDDQTAKVKAVFLEQREKMKALRDDTTTTGPDRHAKMKEIRDGINAKLKGIFTTEQYTKWEKLREERGQHRPPQ